MIINSGKSGKYTTVVVIGVQRGGTSMVAGVLRELGLPMGRNLGVNHEDPQFLPTSLKGILPVIKKRNKEFVKWGWKMPHASSYIVQAIPYLRNPHIIIVTRNIQAIIESQLKHSDTNFTDAMTFSLSRQEQIFSIINEIKCPLLLANYEKAIANPSGFLKELELFLPLGASCEMKQAAINFINPSKGYQRASFERWTYKLFTLSQINMNELELAGAKRRTIHMVKGKSSLLKSGKNPRVELHLHDQIESTDKKTTIYLSLWSYKQGSIIRLRVNIGQGYSVNMTESIELNEGRNIIEIKAKTIYGMFIFPEFEGDESTTAMYNLYSKSEKR